MQNLAYKWTIVIKRNWESIVSIIVTLNYMCYMHYSTLLDNTNMDTKVERIGKDQYVHHMAA